MVCKMGMMKVMTSLTIDVPDEATQIKDLRERLEWFVSEQLKIDQWRKDRYSPDIEELVDEAYAEAEQLKSDGMTSETAREEFVMQWREFRK